jgi:inhibitor of KinA
MRTNFENMNWRLALLGDHALVFSLEEKMSEEIIEKIMALKKSIETLHFDFIKELIPSYHTLTLVYDINLFYQNNITVKNNQSVIEFGNDMLTAFNSAATNSTIKNAAEKIKANNNLIENNSFTDREKIIQIPVCYDERLGIDLENIVSKNKISIEEIIKIHTEET